MDKTVGIIAIIVVIIAIGVIYAIFYKSPALTTTVTTVQSTVATTTVNSAPSNGTTSNNIGSSLPVQTFNNTLTSTQVIGVLGTGWTSAQENAVLGKNTTRQVDGKNYTSASYASANFTGSNGGSYLVTQWVEFGGAGTPASYVNSSLSSFSNANITRGIYNNASYSYASGPALYGGQEASFIYGYKGPYAVTILYKGNSFTQQQAQQLLWQQLANLNVTAGT